MRTSSGVTSRYAAVPGVAFGVGEMPGSRSTYAVRAGSNVGSRTPTSASAGRSTCVHVSTSETRGSHPYTCTRS